MNSSALISVVSVRWEWIGEGFNLMFRQWQGWFLNSAIFWAVTFLLLVPGMFAMFFWVEQTSRSEWFSPRSLGALMVSTILLAILTVAFTFFTGGLLKAALKQVRGGRVELGDLFTGADCFWRLLALYSIVIALVSVGFLLCIIPGILVMGLFFFSMPLVVDRGFPVVEAMRASYEATKGQMWIFALFALVVNLLSGIGSNLCYVGLIVSYPLYFTITAAAFRDTFGLIPWVPQPQSR